MEEVVGALAGDPLDPGVGTRLYVLERAEQPAVRYPTAADAHADRVVGVACYLRRRTPRAGPRRRGRNQREEREPDEGQRDEASGPAIELLSATQPTHRRGHIGQEEERDVAEVGDPVPPL